VVIPQKMDDLNKNASNTILLFFKFKLGA